MIRNDMELHVITYNYIHILHVHVPGSSIGRLGRSLAGHGMPWPAGNSSRPALALLLYRERRGGPSAGL